MSADDAFEQARDAIERVHYGAGYPEIVRLREEGAAMASRLRRALAALEIIASGAPGDARVTARFYLNGLK